MVVILNIASYVCLLAMIAVGLAVVFGMMDIVNLAHAEWVTIGAYTLATVQAVTGAHGYWVALLVAPAVGGDLAGVLSDWLSGCCTRVRSIRCSRPMRSA